MAIERNDGPSALIFTRQNLTQMNCTSEQLSNIMRGGYYCKTVKISELILIATGSEVELAVKAAEQLVRKE